MPVNPNKTDTFSVRCPKSESKRLKDLARRLNTRVPKMMLDAVEACLNDLLARASQQSDEAA